MSDDNKKAQEVLQNFIYSQVLRKSQVDGKEVPMVKREVTIIQEVLITKTWTFDLLLPKDKEKALDIADEIQHSRFSDLELEDFPYDEDFDNYSESVEVDFEDDLVEDIEDVEDNGEME